ncbi:ubiquinol-cytochrome c reductase [Tateyamaria omphalii]|uniref:ABC1 kinase family protein n=1 Tax=Tateyamaria omphalii TaxID=299262 RepID=UPI00167729CE|nr:AarF/ABC1/UbiB kinase family protein [Tateyamaria omphalii]GGX45588.1 ubiquinol-cytochrome c reductase [Tateyamaria omphalii]
MTDHSHLSRPLAVPAGRMSRFGRMGSLAVGVAGRMAFGGALELGQGRRPVARDLLLTPTNMRRIADELARMRGAAMKVGQLMSMDAGDVLPPELAEIMGRLRADADFMPPQQLRDVLDAEWGAGWRKRFAHFDVRPIAAASIGQVHRAQLPDGTELAIKIQYPGIARSIDSDVANIGRLIRLSGLLPDGFELTPYLDEARTQLKEEADYQAEAEHLERFATLLADDPHVVVPHLHASLSTRKVLAMTFVPSDKIESVGEMQQDQRDHIVRVLCDLALRELFVFGVMQTDPNFANYRIDHASGRLVLLDFGATRSVPSVLSDQMRGLLKAGLRGSRSDVARYVAAMELVPDAVEQRYREPILDMIMLVFDEVRARPVLDVSASGLSKKLQAAGEALAADGFVPHPVPMDLLYVQRKIAGMYLLANRLRAHVPVAELITTYTDGG